MRMAPNLNDLARLIVSQMQIAVPRRRARLSRRAICIGDIAFGAKFAAVSFAANGAGDTHNRLDL
jgi:hypothetical protein